MRLAAYGKSTTLYGLIKNYIFSYVCCNTGTSICNISVLRTYDMLLRVHILAMCGIFSVMKGRECLYICIVYKHEYMLLHSVVGCNKLLRCRMERRNRRVDYGGLIYGQQQQQQKQPKSLCVFMCVPVFHECQCLTFAFIRTKELSSSMNTME